MAAGRACSMVGRWRVEECSMERSSDCSAGGKASTLGGASSTWLGLGFGLGLGSGSALGLGLGFGFGLGLGLG